METIYLYCVTRNSSLSKAKEGLSLPNTLKGVGESPLEVITWAGLAGVGSVLPADSYSFTFQDLFLHKEVVEYVHASLPVIPMRFSTTLKGREGVVALLQRHCPQLQETLDRLEGKVEISVRVILEGETGRSVPAFEFEERAGARNGIEYLRQKKQIQEEEHQYSLRAEEVCKVLEQKLRPLIAESQFEPGGSMFSVYCLVRKDKLEEFEKTFGEIKGSLQEEVLYSGPWPPYSFVPKFLEI